MIIIFFRIALVNNKFLKNIKKYNKKNKYEIIYDIITS